MKNAHFLHIQVSVLTITKVKSETKKETKINIFPSAVVAHSFLSLNFNSSQFPFQFLETDLQTYTNTYLNQDHGCITQFSVRWEFFYLLYELYMYIKGFCISVNVLFMCN